MGSEPRRSERLALTRVEAEQPVRPQFTVRAEIHQNPAVEMEVQDEVDHDAIEMRKVPPAVEQVPRFMLGMDAQDELDHDMLPELEVEQVPCFALDMDVQDELDHDMLPELEVEQVPLALTHDARVEDYEP